MADIPIQARCQLAQWAILLNVTKCCLRKLVTLEHLCFDASSSSLALGVRHGVGIEIQSLVANERQQVLGRWTYQAILMPLISANFAECEELKKVKRGCCHQKLESMIPP